MLLVALPGEDPAAAFVLAGNQHYRKARVKITGAAVHGGASSIAAKDKLTLAPSTQQQPKDCRPG